MKSYWKVLKLFIFVKLLTEHAVTSNCNYPSCNGVEHSMCKYPETLDRSAPKCKSLQSKAGLTNEYRRYILDAHNVLRQKVAQGREPGQPEAANMMRLLWNTELETIAQRFANECEKDGQTHDRCRNLMDGTTVGQNSVNDNLNLQHGANKTLLYYKIVQLWYGEVHQANGSALIDSYNFDPAVQHYTQVAWADTDRLGCGYVEQDTDSDWYQPIFMACNYAVAGNQNGTKMYSRGKACSECPHGSECSKKYPGLCSAEKDDFDGVPVEVGKAALRVAFVYCPLISLVSLVFCISFK